ncbi:hypothetical protein [Ruminococcus sp.]
MMKNNNKKKGSTAKKLMPAAMMLAVSASMLGTSTYAWFTMNKTVEVTGLKMQATASSGLEISLGALGDQNAASHSVSVNAPGKNDISWKRAIDVKEYYASVGKLLPASSDDALDIFKVPDTDVYAGGHAVKTTANVTAATEADSATLNLQTYNSTGTYTGIQTLTTGGTEGYYIDIPMWIRCPNTTATDIYATVTVTDPDSTNGSALVKAVRAALIPISSATADSGECAVGYASSSYEADGATAATVTPLTISGTAQTADIFGLKANGSSSAMDTNTAINWPTYHNGKVINATGTYTPSGETGVNLGTTTLCAARGLGETGIAPTNVFTIPAATADNYARVGFIARIWLEGESIYCEDATANQDWNIEFHFDTENTTMADPT